MFCILLNKTRIFPDQVMFKRNPNDIGTCGAQSPECMESGEVLSETDPIDEKVALVALTFNFRNCSSFSFSHAGKAEHQACSEATKHKFPETKTKKKPKLHF